MKRLALQGLAFGAVLLGLVLGSRELTPKPALAAPAHPHIQRYVLAQGVVAGGGCDPSASCSVASLVSGGAISGTTGTFTGAVSGTAFTATTPSATTGFTIVGSSAGVNDITITRTGANAVLKYANSTYWTWDFATGLAWTVYTIGSQKGSGSNAFQVETNGARMDFGAGASDYASSDGTTVTFAGPVKSAATQTRGTITLAAGTGTATVITGAVCVCSSTTANAAYCSVASTTLTATGTGTDVVSYLCF